VVRSSAASDVYKRQPIHFSNKQLNTNLNYLFTAP
jgi:hypothetical protein